MPINSIKTERMLLKILMRLINYGTYEDKELMYEIANYLSQKNSLLF